MPPSSSASLRGSTLASMRAVTWNSFRSDRAMISNTTATTAAITGTGARTSGPIGSIRRWSAPRSASRRAARSPTPGRTPRWRAAPHDARTGATTGLRETQEVPHPLARHSERIPDHDGDARDDPLVQEAAGQHRRQQRQREEHQADHRAGRRQLPREDPRRLRSHVGVPGLRPAVAALREIRHLRRPAGGRRGQDGRAAMAGSSRDGPWRRCPDPGAREHIGAAGIAAAPRW